MRTTVPATLPIFNDQDMAASPVERLILKLVSARTLCEGRRIGRKEAAYGSKIARRCRKSAWPSAPVGRKRPAATPSHTNSPSRISIDRNEKLLTRFFGNALELRHADRQQRHVRRGDARRRAL